MYMKRIGSVVFITLATFLMSAVLIHAKDEEKSKENRFTNIVGMEFALIPPGTFTMGSPKDEEGRDDGEILHRVTITKAFLMGVSEVTQEQWVKVMGKNPSWFQDCGKNCPVESITWNDVQTFIQRLNEMEGGNRYRLPTEAEWEYAARAGSQMAFHWGDRADCSKMNYGNSGSEAESACHKYVAKHKLPKDSPVPVKKYPPNDWGLYDMHGNVWEWCQDWMGDYQSEHVTDPVGPSKGEYRVGRGGAFFREAKYCRSAVRYIFTQGYGYDCVGFRLIGVP